MNIASIQMEITDAEKKANIEKAEQLIDSIEGADLILLPELWNIGYFAFDRYAQESESIDGATVSRLRAKACAKKAHIFAGSFVEKTDTGLYNTSVLIDSRGEIAGQYRKIHLYGHGSQEKSILNPGRDIAVVTTSLGIFGMSTCYDLRFPELYRKMAVAGAECFLVASAWPYPRLEHWLMLNRVRAIENQVFLVTSNCVGVNRGKQFLGHSLAVDPWGSILTGGGDFPCILRAEVDLAEVARIRAMFPPFSDRVLEV